MRSYTIDHLTIRVSGWVWMMDADIARCRHWMSRRESDDSAHAGSQWRSCRCRQSTRQSRFDTITRFFSHILCANVLRIFVHVFMLYVTCASVIKQYNLVPVAKGRWCFVAGEGNRRSGVALAMHHGLSGLSAYGFSGQCLGNEPLAYANLNALSA